MPPKFLTTFLSGQHNDSVDTGGTVARTMIQDAPPLGDRPNQEIEFLSTKPLDWRINPNIELDPVHPKNNKRRRGTTLQIRQLWECTVTELRREGFVATLSDKTKRDSPEEQALFEFENIEISEDDHRLVSPGSVFYWTIGTERTPAGQVKNVSSVEFRRSPAWTRSAIVSASAQAARLKEWFEQSERLNSAER
jgi:hypothetical protein